MNNDINNPFTEITNRIYPTNNYVSEEYRLINIPNLVFPYEISNRGRVRYVLSTGECVYITAKDDGLGDKYVKLQTMLSVEPVLFSVNLLIKETFGD